MNTVWITVYVLVRLGVNPPEIERGQYDRMSCDALRQMMSESSVIRYECLPVKVPALPTIQQ